MDKANAALEEITLFNKTLGIKSLNLNPLKTPSPPVSRKRKRDPFLTPDDPENKVICKKEPYSLDVDSIFEAVYGKGAQPRNEEIKLALISRIQMKSFILKSPTGTGKLCILYIYRLEIKLVVFLNAGKSVIVVGPHSQQNYEGMTILVIPSAGLLIQQFDNFVRQGLNVYAYDQNKSHLNDIG